MRWEKADLRRAVEWMAGRTLKGRASGDWMTRPPEVELGTSDGVEFEDGCMCFAESICRGPDSDTILEFDPPVFWLGTPTQYSVQVAL